MEESRKSARGAVVAIVALVVVVAAAWFGYAAVSAAATGQGSEQAAAGEGGARAGATAAVRWDNPALSSVTITDADGYPITMDTLAGGKVTVVNVWATWCPFCIDEMQDYQGLYDKYGDRMQFVMIDSAESANEIAAAYDYIEENGFTFPVFFDTGRELQEFFSVAAYPTTIVIAADGEVLSNKPGRIVTASFDETLASLLA